MKNLHINCETILSSGLWKAAALHRQLPTTLQRSGISSLLTVVRKQGMVEGWRGRDSNCECIKSVLGGHRLLPFALKDSRPIEQK
ncbi:unnamed protein product [Rodentolepis nana]|uniref:Uncharacterized protein n=1 Tax=Rodentolepis nana TaxID=102285 RepID=A0A0R3TLQ7_RODNA|nr:unnamed protein product [Rodentolepis nana]